MGGIALEVIWTAGAERDLLEIHSGMFEFLPNSDDWIARALHRPLQSAVRLLSLHPEVGARVKGVKGVRRWLLGPQRQFGLFYVIESRGIVVHALLDMRQSPNAIWDRLRKI